MTKTTKKKKTKKNSDIIEKDKRELDFGDEFLEGKKNKSNVDIDGNISIEKKKKKKKKKNHKEPEKVSFLKKFFNKPLPLVIVLIIICLVQLFFLFDMRNRNCIYIADLDKEDIQISGLHMFLNDDMNYFYASPARYFGEDKQIYNFEMGYYVKLGKNEYLTFTSRARDLDKATSLKEVIEEMSGWNFFEPTIQDYYFSDVFLENLDELHFMVKASTVKGSTEADVLIDYPIELNKITK